MSRLNDVQRYVLLTLTPFLIGRPNEYLDGNFKSDDKIIENCRTFMEHLGIYDKATYDRYMIHWYNKRTIKSKLFNKMSTILLTSSDSHRQAYIDEMSKDEKLAAGCRVASIYGHRLGVNGIKGYDNYSIMCGYLCGYVLDYITEEEFWEATIPLAKEIQGFHSTFEEYLIATCVGSMYDTGREPDSYSMGLKYHMENILIEYVPILDVDWSIPMDGR